MPKTETDIEKRNKYGMLCGIVGIFLNLILFAGKLFAGMFSGAISITADAFNNLSDAGSSAVTLIAVSYTHLTLPTTSRV